MMNFENDIRECIKVINNGGIILYPTDTIWGIGCDATNPKAVKKIFTIKQREDSKSMIVLISPDININEYVDNPDPKILNYISNTSQPTTAIYKKGKNIAKGIINEDGTVAIRIVHDEFCAALINALNKPLVSTSANISGMPAAATFAAIDTEIKKGVDYIVQHRQSDFKVAKPSCIIKLSEERKIIIVRP